ncbi:unnamed protein product [Blepharisma stoltei]|uniref:Uncharacterized protein n=1 Tax=Blepharisma stoltei TaxID=1481888 RepID=A0AAU9JAY5_9CILI|nr:unnamed protein product [Blepharisma stoltei]
MQVKEDIAKWLRNAGIIDELPPAFGPNKIILLDAFTTQHLESGQLILPLIRRLHTIMSANNREVSPLPESKAMKTADSASAKLYNWKIIYKALDAVGINVDEDKKLLIMAGDNDIVIEILEEILEKEKSSQRFLPKISSTPTLKKKGKKPKIAKDGALYIDSVNVYRGLDSTDTCLEFLLVTFCQYFELKPKQAAGLLTQGNKYLAHIIVKGLKGDLKPIYSWYKTILEHLSRLTDLMINEEPNGSIKLVLSAFRPGFLSKNEDIAHACCDLYNSLFEVLIEKNMMGALWDWFQSEGVSACVISLQRLREGIANDITDLFVKFGPDNLNNIVCNIMKETAENSKIYLSLLQTLFEGLINHKEVFKRSGLFDYYIGTVLREGDYDSNKDLSTRHIGINLLCNIWMEYQEYFKTREDITSSFLSVLKRGCRDKSWMIRISCLSRLFALLDSFYETKNLYAPILFKTLTFLLIENYSSETMREFIMSNMIQLLEQIQSLPVGIIVEPLFKQLQILEEISMNIFDFDFYIAIARHPRISSENAVQMLDSLGRVYLNDIQFSKAASTPFVLLTSRFFDKPIVQEYIIKYLQVALNMIVASEKQKKPLQKKLPRYLNQPVVLGQPLTVEDFDEETTILHKRNLILDLTAKLMKLENSDFNEKIKLILLQGNRTVKRSTGNNFKGFEVLLEIIGNSDEMIREYESQNMSIMPYREAMSDRAESGIMSPAIYRPPPITGKIADDLEKIKHKKIQSEKAKKEQETFFKNKSMKMLQSSRTVIERRKIELGLSETALIAPKILPEIGGNVYYIDLNEEPPNEVSTISKITKRYALPLSLLYRKYQKYQKISQNRTELHKIPLEDVINETQILLLLKDHSIFGPFLKREDAIWIIKEYAKRDQKSDTMFDMKGFVGILIQVAGNLASNYKSQAILPISYNYYSLLMEFRNNGGKATWIYDEPDPGNGDREVVKYLNSMLKENPEYEMPPNYQKFIDHDIELSYFIPEEIGLKESQKNSIEILDELLFDTLGVHFLHPQLSLTPVTRARGYKPMKAQSPRHKILPPSLPPYINLSSVLRFELSQLINRYPTDHAIECAKVLEDLLYSVEINSATLVSVSPIPPSKIQNQALHKKEMEAAAQRLNQQKFEEKFQKIKKQTEAEHQKLKEEKERKEREEQKLKEEQEARENERKMKKEEKLKEKIKEKKKMVQNWKEIKEKEESEKQEKEEMEKRWKESRREEIERKLKERTQNMITEMKKITQEKEEAKKKALESEENNKEKLNELKKKSMKFIDEQRQKRSQEYKEKLALNQLSVDHEIRSVLEEFSKSLEVLFDISAKSSKKSKIEAPYGLDYAGFLKFALNFVMIPGIIPQERLLKIFRSITKDKVSDQSILSYPEFEEALIRIAAYGQEYIHRFIKKPVESSDLLNCTGDTLRGLLKYMNLTQDPKDTMVLMQQIITSKPLEARERKKLANDILRESSN